MSIVAMNWAWEQETTPSEKLVLLALADRANDDGGKCFPSQKDISQRTRLSRPTVSLTIKSLERKGLLEINQRRHIKKGAGFRRANEYFLQCKGNEHSPKCKGTQHSNVRQSNIQMLGNLTSNHQGEPPEETPIETSGKPQPAPSGSFLKTSGEVENMEKENKGNSDFSENENNDSPPEENGIIPEPEKSEFLDWDDVIDKIGTYHQNGTLKMPWAWRKLFQAKYGYDPHISAKDAKLLERVYKEHGLAGLNATILAVQDWSFFVRSARDREGAFDFHLTATVGTLYRYFSTALWLRVAEEQAAAQRARIEAEAEEYRREQERIAKEEAVQLAAITKEQDAQRRQELLDMCDHDYEMTVREHIRKNLGHGLAMIYERELIRAYKAKGMKHIGMMQAEKAVALRNETGELFDCDEFIRVNQQWAKDLYIEKWGEE